MQREKTRLAAAALLLFVGCGAQEKGSGRASSEDAISAASSQETSRSEEENGLPDGSSAEGGSGPVSETGGEDDGPGNEEEPPSHHLIPDGLVSINERQLVANGSPFQIRGVCWNPVRLGETHPAGLDFLGASEADIPLMVAAGINAVRTYAPITDRTVLDRLHAAGIKVIMSVYAWGGAAPESALDAVNTVKDHPAILMWLVGNEWNYNGLYVDLSFDDSLALVREAAERIKDADPNHLVATVYGELPSPETLAALSVIDVWGINSYRGISFYDLFSSWSALSSRPMFLAEFGADAYDARDGGSVNLLAQAEATAALIGELEANAARNGGVSSGGTLFEWSDEWWKDGAGDASEHDVGGVAPGGGPYPDQTFNEEWWGVVTIDRTPRPAYFALQTAYLTP